MMSRNLSYLNAHVAPTPNSKRCVITIFQGYDGSRDIRSALRSKYATGSQDLRVGPVQIYLNTEIQVVASKCETYQKFCASYSYTSLVGKKTFEGKEAFNALQPVSVAFLHDPAAREADNNKLTTGANISGSYKQQRFGRCKLSSCNLTADGQCGSILQKFARSTRSKI